MKILLVEDDELIAQPLATALTDQHYVVECAADGQAGWDLLESFDYDLILLDVKLPKIDGITLCRRLRSQGNQTPILLLTAQEATTNKVLGLDAGADDYLTKPFEFEELLARIRALLRRGRPALPPILQWHNLQLNPSTCEVTCARTVLHLTPKEYGLLELFLRNPQRIFSCSALIDHQWTLEDPPTDETVRSHLKGLRQKLKSAGVVEDPIETIYGIGYRLKSEAASPSVQEQKLDHPPSRTRKRPGEPNNPTAIAEAKTLQGVTEIWQQVREKLEGRVAVLKDATKAIQQNRLSEAQRQEAEQAAHKLVGSLGMFGADAGSQLAHQIEQYFQSEDDQDAPSSTLHRNRATNVADRKQATSLAQMVKALQQELQNIDTTSSLNTLSTDNSLVQQTPIAKIMIVDDDPQILMVLKTLLTPWGLEVIVLDDPRQFLDRLETTVPNLLILDIKMPYRSGIELCQLVRNNPRWSDLPILFLTAHVNSKTMQQVYEAGADDYVRKPIAGPELITRILNRLERSRLSKNLIEMDTLTRVANRRRSTQDLSRLLQESDRTQQPFCLAIVNLDNLKQINRDYGHAAGDQVLSHLGDLLRQTFQKEEAVGRWGGTEFVIGMLKTSVKVGLNRVSEVLKKLKKIEFTGLKRDRFHATFSAAVVGYPQEGQDLEALYWSADTILQSAKASGGDCVLVKEHASS